MISGELCGWGSFVQWHQIILSQLIQFYLRPGSEDLRDAVRGAGQLRVKEPEHLRSHQLLPPGFVPPQPQTNRMGPEQRPGPGTSVRSHVPDGTVGLPDGG